MCSTVSVCIATYNRRASLLRAIECVREQSFLDQEIIVVDDGSTDGTREMMRQRFGGDPRILYIRHKVNKGLSAARNTALARATGKYFCFLDDDDRWETEFVSSFVHLARRYDERWCFCCGNRIEKPGGFVVCKIPVMEGPLIDYIRQGFTPPVAGQFYFISQLKRIDGFNEDIKSGVDHDLWLRLAFNGVSVKGLKQCLANANTDKKRTSMTTSFEHRVKGISESLAIWKSEVTENMGEDFYKHLKRSYSYYLCEKFFAIYFLRRKFVKSLLLLLQSPWKVRIVSKTIQYLYSELTYKLGRKSKKKILRSIGKPLFPKYLG